MDTNPYAPPKAAVADDPTRTTAIKRRSVVVMLLFTLLTLGFYPMIWFFRRRTAINHLNSPRKLQLWPLITYSAVVGITIVINVISAPDTPETVIGTGPAILLMLLEFGVGILMIVQCFIIKDILEDHIAGPEDPTVPQLFTEHVKLSGLATFFFSVFYLQYIINKHIAAPS